MPSRNSIKRYAPNEYYHAYNRGVAKQLIFHDSQDKDHFLKIIARHLDPMNTDKRHDGVAYEKFDKELELLSFCLMGNHFHLLFHMGESTEALRKFMQSLQTAYTMYYNKKYKRVGTLFQGVFKCSVISDNSYLLHITRYIHLNPRRYLNYTFSSLQYYLGKHAPPWLVIYKITSLFADEDEYRNFLEDYEDMMESLEAIKYELANDL